MNKISLQDIEKNIGFKIENKNLIKNIQDSNLKYKKLSAKKFQNYLLEYIKTLAAPLISAGKDRIGQWQSGWSENLENFKQSKSYLDIIPKYHGKNNISRLNGYVIETYCKFFDYYLNSFFVDAIIFKYINQFNEIFEFGCGTGYHLFRIQDSFPDKEYTGLDWVKSSQDGILAFAECNGVRNVRGAKFDYFNPDYSIEISGSLIYTIASLEQIGSKFEPFLQYVLDKKPSLCVHFEPIEEVLDENNLLDYLTIGYFRKRNYLQGFLTRLQELEKDGKIEILESRRLNYGSKFIEGHTLIIWKPL